MHLILNGQQGHLFLSNQINRQTGMHYPSHDHAYHLSSTRSEGQSFSGRWILNTLAKALF